VLREEIEPLSLESESIKVRHPTSGEEVGTIPFQHDFANSLLHPKRVSHVVHMPIVPRREVADATISKESRKQGAGPDTTGGADAMDPAGVSPQRKHQSKSSSLSSKQLDLHVIDEAFGKHSDLYEDVLQVATSATQEEIQLAYFDRRSELFTLLAKIDSKPQSEAMASQRYKAERKMDSVVLAVRVLGDPTLRAVYDQLRSERIDPPFATQQTSTRQSPAPRLVTPPAKAAGAFDDDIYETSTMEDTTDAALEGEAAAAVPRKDSKKKGMSARKQSSRASSKKWAKDDAGMAKAASKDSNSTNLVSDDEEENVILPPSSHRKVQNLIEDNLSTAMESRQEDDTLAAETMDTLSTVEKDEVAPRSSGVFSCLSGNRMLRKVSDEISGAFEDTLVSVDQVFNAFTLTDKDIKAVTKKIHKAKRQLES
jgi:curved DNA-binding protein CbpA